MTIAFNFKRLQNSEYENVPITVAKKEPIMAGIVPLSSQCKQSDVHL